MRPFVLWALLGVAHAFFNVTVDCNAAEEALSGTGAYNASVPCFPGVNSLQSVPCSPLCDPACVSCSNCSECEAALAGCQLPQAVLQSDLEIAQQNLTNYTVLNQITLDALAATRANLTAKLDELRLSSSRWHAMRDLVNAGNSSAAGNLGLLFQQSGGGIMDCLAEHGQCTDTSPFACQFNFFTCMEFNWHTSLGTQSFRDGLIALQSLLGPTWITGTFSDCLSGPSIPCTNAYNTVFRDAFF